MPRELPNINYELDGKNPVIDSFSSMYNIPFEKPPEYFSNLESRNNFIKGCERLVRTNDRYSKYIYYLKNKIKLNHCQVLMGLSDEDCTVEMHHGPIFTLYDYCDIMINYFLQKKLELTTFDVADFVLEEHRKNRIQVVMLSSTVHQEVHDREIFIHPEQAWGNLRKFIKMYGTGIDKDLRDKYNRYMDKALMMDGSSAYHVLDLSDLIKKNGTR